MCVKAVIDGMLYSGHGELAAVLGRGNIVLHSYARNAPPADNECLCHIDWEATAASAGLTLHENDGLVVTLSRTP